MKRYYLVTVKDACGTYTTNTIAGHKAGCTAGAEQAVGRLAEKLFGDRPVRIEAVAGNGNHFHLHLPEGF